MTQQVLARAREGDEQAFRQLVEPFTRELHVHCYRLLGSFHDAEDIVQETLVAAWHGLPRFEERSSLRAWLYRIATNRCLNARRDSARRPPSPPFRPPEPTSYDEVTWLEPYLEPGPEAGYERRETIELAFIVALRRMPPRQAAVLVLRDVLGFSAAETAAMLDSTQTSVKGVLQRARAAAGPSLGGTPAPEPGSARERAITQRFATAFAADDIDAVVAMLTDDAWLTMPPAPHQYQGQAAIGSFLRASADWRAGRRFELLPTRANSQPAFWCSLGGEPAGLLVLSLRAAQIGAITRFLQPSTR